MDRERRLLYAVVILAAVFVAMTLYSSYLESGLPVRTMAAVEETARARSSWSNAGFTQGLPGIGTMRQFEALSIVEHPRPYASSLASPDPRSDVCLQASVSLQVVLGFPGRSGFRFVVPALPISAILSREICQRPALMTSRARPAPFASLPC